MPPAPADDILARLLVPVALEDVNASLDANDGVLLEIDYFLREVGEITIVVHGADDGSGLGLVRVDDAVVAEVQFVDGAPVTETLDVTSLRPGRAHALAASVVQVWSEHALAEALAAMPTEERDLKCKVAGSLAGATAGILVGATCGLFFKSPTGCGKAAGTAYGATSYYITNKCNGAQNH